MNLNKKKMEFNIIWVTVADVPRLYRIEVSERAWTAKLRL